MNANAPVGAGARMSMLAGDDGAIVKAGTDNTAQRNGAPTLFYVVKDRLEPDPRLSGPQDATADDFWTETAMQAVIELAKTGEVFEAYDCVLRFGTPEPTSSAQWGALMRSAASRGLITAVAAGPSKRPSTNGALTRKWRGTGAS